MRSSERRTIVAAAGVALLVAGAIVAGAALVGDDGGSEAVTTTRPAEPLTAGEARADRACRRRFSVGFSRAFMDDACPIYVPRALAGAPHARIIELPEFKVEICVEAGRIEYESGQVATRLDEEAYVETVRVDCRRELLR
jgi:hypothetical protein